MHPYEARSIELIAPLDGVMARVCHTLFISPQLALSQPWVELQKELKVNVGQQREGQHDLVGESGEIGSSNWLQDPRLLHQRLASW